MRRSSLHGLCELGDTGTLYTASPATFVLNNGNLYQRTVGPACLGGLRWIERDRCTRSPMVRRAGRPGTFLPASAIATSAPGR